MKYIAKNKHKVTIEIIGGNSESVTGSCSKITTENHVYLFECGMIQDGHTPLENYKLNSKLLQKIKPQEIDYIIIGHNHLDHIGLIPALYARGKCNAKIIVPKISIVAGTKHIKIAGLPTFIKSFTFNLSLIKISSEFFSSFLRRMTISAILHLSFVNPPSF